MVDVLNDLKASNFIHCVCMLHNFKSLFINTLSLWYRKFLTLRFYLRHIMNLQVSWKLEEILRTLFFLSSALFLTATPLYCILRPCIFFCLVMLSFCFLFFWKRKVFICISFSLGKSFLLFVAIKSIIYLTDPLGDWLEKNNVTAISIKEQFGFPIRTT